MRMTVVNVRKMCVRMSNRHMNMRMGMRLGSVPLEIVLVLMVLVVTMPVRVGQPFMRVTVFVAFAQMQPDANAHE